MKIKDCLFIIPARAGSKGVPGKNIRLFHGKPLIQYSIDYALQLTNRSHVCISTDDEKIKSLGEDLGLEIPFKRPAELSSDLASANDVIKHAINFYKNKGLAFDTVVYLQPTSPFRLLKHFTEALAIYEKEKPDMVVSVCESGLNPYFSLFEENSIGNLKRSKDLPKHITRRQDAPKTYMYNGSIYIINVGSLMRGNLHEMESVKKYVMEEIYAVDIDTEKDWIYAEFLAEKNFIKYD